MMLSAFIHGFVLAIGLILPLGVQNLFVFTQGVVRKNFISVVPIIMTAAICDTLLILIAVLGVSLTVLSFGWLKTLLVVGGFIFLIYIGVLTWKNNGEKNHSNSEKSFPGFYKAIRFTAMISILNPHAIIDTIGVIGTSSLFYQGTMKIAFSLACILVSWIWFFTLAASGRLIGAKFQTTKSIQYLNKVSAVIMWGTALYLLRNI